jgi:hypothetical protein
LDHLSIPADPDDLEVAGGERARDDYGLQSFGLAPEFEVVDELTQDGLGCGYVGNVATGAQKQDSDSYESRS